MTFNLGHVIGADGKGISDISKTDTTGNIDTYTITYTNGDTSTFTVTNGADGTIGPQGPQGPKGDKGDKGDPGEGVNIVTSWSSSVSDSNVASEKLTKDSLDGKANSVHSHSISDVANLQNSLNAKAESSDLGDVAFSNDYNDLDNIPSSFTPSSHTHSISNVTNLQSSLNAKANSSDLGIVATSNSYTDLDDIPLSFTPASHTHAISEVTNLQTNLNNKVNTSDIANNLTTTTSGKVLDARQGKILADLIGDAIVYINQ